MCFFSLCVPLSSKVRTLQKQEAAGKRRAHKLTHVYAALSAHLGLEEGRGARRG